MVLMCEIGLNLGHRGEELVTVTRTSVRTAELFLDNTVCPGAEPALDHTLLSRWTAAVIA